MDSDDKNSVADARDDKDNIVDDEEKALHGAATATDAPTAADTFLSHVRRSFWDDI